MNKTRTILFIISIILFGWLFTKNLNEIDFFKTKNDAMFYRSAISQVENSRNLEELKPFAVKQIEYLKKSREINSENAKFRSWLILALTLLNIALFIISKKLTKK